MLLHDPTGLASSALGVTVKPRHTGGQGTKGQDPLPVPKTGATFFLFLGGRRNKALEREVMDKAGRPFLTQGPLPIGPSILELAFCLSQSSLLLPRRAAERAHLSKAGLEMQTRLGRGPPRPRAPPLPGPARGEEASLCPRMPAHSPWTPRPVSKVTFSNRVLGPPQADIVVA